MLFNTAVVINADQNSKRMAQLSFPHSRLLVTYVGIKEISADFVKFDVFWKGEQQFLKTISNNLVFSALVDS